tara:strand:- start:75 stop:878 length:804 start_codon:yes stop_codon:yes gene_type:complete
MGLFAESKSAKKFLIKLFIKKYNVDMTEARNTSIDQYPNFNAFFTRELREGARPIDNNPTVIVSPADGRLLAAGRIDGDRLIQAKNHCFSCNDLLGGNNFLASTFSDGNFATIYLSPKDYHRVHMPLKGTLIKTIHIPGRLFSVGYATSSNIPNLFARNERLVCVFSTDAGLFSLILVGAMVVGSIKTVWTKEAPKVLATPEIKEIDYKSQEIKVNLDKGAEVGRFELGSTVIVLFEQKLMQLNSNIVANKPIRMGESLGLISNNVK